LTLPKAILVALLAFAAMSTAGYVTAELALSGATPTAVTNVARDASVAGSASQSTRQLQGRELAEITATPSPTATRTATPEASPTPTDTPEPPTATPVPPTNTPVPPTATPIPPTATPIPPTATPVPPTPTPVPPTPTPPPPTATPEQQAAVEPPAGGELVLGTITPYADSLTGNTLGCNGYGAYEPENPTIIAVSPDRYEEWPCGTTLGICGVDADTGVITSCVVGVRQDSCPGCTANHLDVSRAIFEIICGSANRCPVVITKLE
jgi:hypothetical protein